MMHLVMRAGRSNKAKQAFYQQVVHNLAQNRGIKPENVLITISENHDIDWSFKDGTAVCSLSRKAKAVARYHPH